MTIRQNLLLAFLMFSTVFSVLMTVLAYSRSRAALSDEIGINLENQASTLMQQIDAMLFERVTELQEWRRLDIMQEVKVDDVDKRLARFLSDIRSAYAGVYKDIYCVYDGRIVAASDPARIGKEPPVVQPWITIRAFQAEIQLTRPGIGSENQTMSLSTSLIDAFNDEQLGKLVAQFDWMEISRLLDQATRNSGRHMLLLDADGSPLAVSDGLRSISGLGDKELSRWYDDDMAHGVLNVDGTALNMEKLLVGFAHSTNYKGLPARGWSIIVLTPERIAFSAIRDLLWTLMMMLGGIIIIAIILATRISARTARPIQRLTRYVREIGNDMDTPARIVTGGREIEELSLAFNRMIEDLKHSREHLKRVSKLAAVGEMSAMLAHELRTPLGIISSSAQLIDRQGKLDSSGHEMLSYLIHECNRIDELLTRLLESARPRQPEFAVHDINAIVRQVIEMLEAKANLHEIHIEFTPSIDPIMMRCDYDQMLQVLVNLLMNAIQVLPRSGHVRVSTAIEGNEIVLDVEDDGPGIPAEERGSILEPFVSFRDGGIGLGLPIVGEIIAMHKGSIHIDHSGLGGAWFCIRIPTNGTEAADGSK